MIGKTLSQRHAPGPLAPERATEVMREALATQAENLVRVRAQGAEMVAFLVVRADAASLRVGRALGFELKRGGTVVFGLRGADAARLLAGSTDVTDAQRAWLEAPSGPRETKVYVMAEGTALVTLEIAGGATQIRVA
jgi:hypothetical protein